MLLDLEKFIDAELNLHFISREISLQCSFSRSFDQCDDLIIHMDVFSSSVLNIID